MEPKNLEIQMLGDFSLRAGDNKISDTEGRSHKVWLLLAYMIYHRDRMIPQEELVEVLWGSFPKTTNPVSALKTTFHRVRGLLDQLWPSAGHQLILRQEGGYVWNGEIPVTVDVDTFEKLCRSDCGDESEWEKTLLKALKLYQGDFLDRLSSETWIVPVSTYFHNLYIDAALKVLPLLMGDGRFQQAEELCRTVLSFEPLHEGIYRYMMRAMMEQGDAKAAVAAYEELSKQLFTEFGVMPEEETRAVARAAARPANEIPMQMEAVCDQLRENDESKGALVCEYDFFRILCRFAARSMSRSGVATHIALLSVSGKVDEDLSKRSLERVMENLEEQLRLSLRRGDATSRCSGSQYILMLPQANYENSCMVCDRVVNAFARRYPHSPAKLQYTVRPLEPIL